MEILQLPILALEERIDQEMEENPVLELDQEESELPEESYEKELPDAPTDEERELVVGENDNAEDFERLLNLDEQWPDTFEERSRPSRGEVEEAASRRHDAMANMTDRPPSLENYLQDQLGWFTLEEPLRALALRIISNLDSNGYLPLSLADILDSEATEEDLALAQKALELVQRLDPPGVGARDLRECLMLQIQPGIPALRKHCGF